MKKLILIFFVCSSLVFSGDLEKGIEAFKNRDYRQAVVYLQKESDIGNAAASYNLGQMYLYGSGVNQDYIKAQHYFEKTCSGNEVLGCAKLGMMYATGLGIPKDIIKAKTLLKKSCLSGDKKSCDAYDDIDKGSAAYLKGVDAISRNDMKKAFLYLEKAAKQGESIAQYNLASLYLQKSNFSKAKYWFEKAANNGMLEAQDNLASMYLKGDGIQQNPYKGLKWLKKAAESGFSKSQCSLGLVLYGGLFGVDKDKEKGEYWIKKSYQNGNELCTEIWTKNQY